MTFVMAGGGTGGHVMPAIAVADELRRRGHVPVFVGTRQGLEARLVPRAGYEIDWIEASGFNRVSPGAKLRALARLPASVAASRNILDRRHAAALFSMGGYVAAPPMIAARMKQTPIVLMEPNAMPGLVSRWMAKHVTRALVSFEEAAAYFPKGRAELAGLPVRAEFFACPARTPGNPPRVLITGGSQGSKRLNQAFRDSWPLFAAEDWPAVFHHQTGSATGAEFLQAFREAGVPGEAAEFIEDMPSAFAAADLVVSRSGAATIAELAAAGKASILIPYPHAADDHQLKNARAMERAGAAEVIEDRELSGRLLYERIRMLTADATRLARMSAAAKRLAKPRAAARAADVLEAVARC
jgi:UDP-N-acetylglucosamine--N-acetylmuramyl-(pentapeptide) pyrophosphoryl-undecaprenol N-acetylglucosamine transferase